jgi:PAS domain-containing protein
MTNRAKAKSESFVELGGHHFAAVDAMIAAETSPVALVLTTLSAQILYANRVFQVLFDACDLGARHGVALQELGKRYFDPRLLVALARTGQARQFAVRFKRGGVESSWWCQARRENGESGVPKWLVFSFTEMAVDALAIAAAASVERTMDEMQRLDRFGTWTMPVSSAASAGPGEMYWSRGLSELLRRSHSEEAHPARDWLDAIHRNDRPGVLDALLGLIADGTAYSIEYRVADNSGRIFCSRGQALPAQPGTGPSIAGFERDVTEAVRHAQRECEQLYLQRALADCYELPAFAVDRQQRLRWFNAPFVAWIRDICGSEPRLDISLVKIMPHAGQRRRVVHNMRQAMLGKRLVAESQLRTRDGESHRFDLTYNPILDAAGEILGAVAVAMDVTVKHSTHPRGRRAATPRALAPEQV